MPNRNLISTIPLMRKREDEDMATTGIAFWGTTNAYRPEPTPTTIMNLCGPLNTDHLQMAIRPTARSEQSADTLDLDFSSSRFQL